MKYKIERITYKGDTHYRVYYLKQYKSSFMRWLYPDRWQVVLDSYSYQDDVITEAREFTSLSYAEEYVKSQKKDEPVSQFVKFIEI